MFLTAGERRDEMMAQIPRAQAPDGLKVGQVVQLSNGMPVSAQSTCRSVVCGMRGWRRVRCCAQQL